MDKPILALILVVVGVALSLTAVSMVFGYLIPWQNSGRVAIESVDVLWLPSGSYITVNVRNVGGVALSSCSVRMLNPMLNVDDVTTPTIPPGGMATFAENGVPGLQLSNVYIFEAACLTPQGQTVVDRKSAQPHT